MKPIRILFQSLLLIILMLGSAQGQEVKQDTGAEGQQSTAAAEDADSQPFMNVNVQLYDLELVTQEGRRVKFKSDVVADKLVAMTFIFTTCTTICPIYNAIFSQLQPLLGERLGKDVVMVTLTLDPTRDVVGRMKRTAQKFGAQPGWLYLTGEKPNVDQVLKGLGAYFPNFEEHPPMALVGDGKTGTWKRFNGFPSPEQVLAMIDELQAARGAGR
jgi:protein SCO1/2